MKRFKRILVVCAASGVIGCQAHKSVEEPDVPAQVQAASTVERPEPVMVHAQATVIADPRHVSRISSVAGQPVLAVMVQDGQAVHRGQVLVDLADDPQAHAAVQQADIQLSVSNNALKREEALVQAGVEPRIAVDQARAQAAIAASRARSAQELLDQIEKGTHLASPITGVVFNVAARVGQVVVPGADLVDVADPRDLMARLQIEPEDLPKVSPGQVVRLQAPGSKEMFPARIATVLATVNPQTQLGEADAVLQGSHPGLGIGRFLTADIVVATADALLVPAAAIVHRDDGDAIYVVAAGKAHKVAVRRGQRVGDQVEVWGHVTARQQVATLGAYELSDGDPVTIATGSPE